jgi:hypothetical protein
MPLFPPILVDTLIAIVTVAYGIRWERWYTEWISVLMNLVFTVFFLGANDLPLLVYVALSLFLIIGIILLLKCDEKIGRWKLKRLYPIFGSKTFGALSLVGAFATLSWLGWAGYISKQILGFSNGGSMFLVAWIILSIVFHVVGYALFGRRKKK